MVKMKPILLCSLAAVSTLLIGCGSVVHTSPLPASSSNSNDPVPLKDGIVYYLPKGIIKVDGVYDSAKGWTVTITPEIYADRSARYVLGLNNRYPFFDHNCTLTTNNKGLLQTVTGVATDHTVDSVSSLIGAAGSALSFAASLGGAAAGLRDVNANPPFHVVLDPYDPNKTVETTSSFTIAVTEAPAPAVRPPPSDRSYVGPLTRLLVPFIVTVKSNDSAQRASVVLPDRSATYVMTIPRGPFVTDKSTLQFSDGSLTSWDMERPSIAYGILNVPKNILSALAPIPGNVRQQQVAKIDATKTILTDEAAIKKLEQQ